MCSDERATWKLTKVVCIERMTDSTVAYIALWGKIAWVRQHQDTEVVKLTRNTGVPVRRR